MKIAVVGTGYVGLSLAILLSQHHEVMALDIVPEKIAMLNNKQSHIEDKEIKEFLANKSLNLTATLDKQLAYQNAEFVIIATPTDYDATNNYFDTSSVEVVIQDIIKINSKSGQEQYYVEDGIIEFKDNNLSILTSSIFNIKDADKDKINKILKLAEESGNKDEISDQAKYLLEQKIEVLRSLN